MQPGHLRWWQEEAAQRLPRLWPESWQRPELREVVAFSLDVDLPLPEDLYPSGVDHLTVDRATTGVGVERVEHRNWHRGTTQFSRQREADAHAALPAPRMALTFHDCPVQCVAKVANSGGDVHERSDSELKAMVV